MSACLATKVLGLDADVNPDEYANTLADPVKDDISISGQHSMLMVQAYLCATSAIIEYLSNIETCMTHVITESRVLHIRGQVQSDCMCSIPSLLK